MTGVCVMQKIKQIKGIVASRFEFKISGSAFIVTQDDIFKFKKGQILIAESTNQNYLPAMLKAKAIITECGGLLSHSAIISREFNIPCIVNAKDILEYVKNGNKIIIYNNGCIDIYE